MFGKCKVCERLRAENEYLKKLIDNLLSSKGISPVTMEEIPLEETEEDKAERANVEKGVIKYGD